MRTADEYRLGQAASDLLLVLSVPLLLVAIHFLVPPAVQERFALFPDGYGPLTLFTAAFLHAGPTHLAGNVVGFAVGVLSAYCPCLLLAERRWFWLSTIALVLGLPILVNWTSLQVLALYFDDWSAASRGFSGVASGFGGFAFATLLAYVGRWTDRTTVYFAGMAVFLLLCWEILVIYAATLPTVTTGLVALGVGLCVAGIGRRTLDAGLPTSRAGWLRAGVVVAVSLGLVAVLASLILVLFPADLVDDGQFTNVFAHAIGFGYGFVISGWGYRYWRTTHR